MGASKSKSSSKPKDMTPEAFKNLQQPFADVLAAALPGIPQGTERIVEGYQGPTTTPITGNEAATLNQLQGMTANQTPFQLGAPTQVQGAAGGGSGLTDALLGMTALSGLTPGGASNFVQGLGIGNGAPQQPLSGFAQELQGASQTGAFGGDNPFLQAAIEAAQRPTLQGLEEMLTRTLPGRFTQAGQFVNPQGSSAFDRAAALATRGVGQSLADIATNMSFGAMESARGREADALGAELGRRGQFGLQTQALEADAMQNQLTRALQSLGLGSQLATEQQQRGQIAAQTDQTAAQTQSIGQQVQSQQIQDTIANLQAQALPRLIQDLGVERGIEAFNNNVNALLSSMGIAAGVTRPVIAQEGKSSSKGFQL